MSIANEFASFSAPMTGVDPARVVGDLNLVGGYSGRDHFVGDEQNPGLKFLLESERILDTAWPLVLFGETGTGKSALALIIANRVLAESAGQLLALTARDFARRFADSVETGTVEEFRETVEQAACLLIEDIQGMHSSPAAQQELLVLLDRAASQSKPVIVTANSTWSDIGVLGSRLCSRLTAGLCLKVKPPGDHSRRDHILQLAATFDFVMSEPFAEKLARRLPTAWPAIKAWFVDLENRLTALDISDREITDSLLNKVAETEPPLELEKMAGSIIKSVAQTMKVRIVDIKGPARKKSLVAARCMVVWILRKRLHISFTAIGKILGGRDHSTIMHSLDRAGEMLADPGFAGQLRSIERRQLPTDLT